MPSLIAELNRIQSEDGWLKASRLSELAEALGVPLYRIEGLASFYTHYRRTPPPALQFDVCRDLSCRMAQGPAFAQQLREACAGRADVEIREVSCLGRCDQAPAVAVGSQTLRLDDPNLLEQADAAQHEPPLNRPTRVWPNAAVYREGEPRWGALRKALAGERGRSSQELEAAGLRGMGGAAFPTGRKWSLVAEASADCRYVICNADESEPGAFKDREILHDLPHLVIEGMALAAHELDARRGWIFIRHEYRPERDALEAALQKAREDGALGPSILGTDFSFDIEIFVSPGGYILGEETALLECLEDRRGEPRNKPPFPGQVGLFGCPTLINNVETYAHATAILHRGAAWWHSLGRQGFTGHKFLSVSGDVTRPGVSLVPFGTTIREVLELCGGMLGGQELETFAPGGASSRFLGPEHLDTPIDFDALADAGSMLGAGSLVFVAKGRDLLDIGLNVTRFFRNESCGKCVPCRVGIEKALEHIDRHGSDQSETTQLLSEMHETLERTSLCGLGQVALSPLLSLLERVPATRSRE